MSSLISRRICLYICPTGSKRLGDRRPTAARRRAKDSATGDRSIAKRQRLGGGQKTRRQATVVSRNDSGSAARKMAGRRLGGGQKTRRWAEDSAAGDRSIAKRRRWRTTAMEDDSDGVQRWRVTEKRRRTRPGPPERCLNCMVSDKATTRREGTSCTDSIFRAQTLLFSSAVETWKRLQF
jgi:hypothetical protein